MTGTFRLVASIFVIALCGRASVAFAQRAEGPWQVEFHTLPLTAKGVPADAARHFAAVLDARPGFEAAAAERPGRSWREVARKGAVIRLLAVEHGAQIDFVALAQRPGNAVPVAAAHRIAAINAPAVRMDRLLPGPQQLSENALVELAADLARALSRDDAAEMDRRDVEVVVSPWQDATMPTAALLLSGDAAGDAETPPEAARPDLLEGIAALMQAATHEAGATVAGDKAPHLMEVAVATLPQGLRLRMGMAGDPSASEIVFPEVPHERLYATLRAGARMLLQMQASAVPAVFPMRGVRPELLATGGGKLVYHDGDRAHALEVASGRQQWSLAVGGREGLPWAVRAGASDVTNAQTRLVFAGRVLDWQSGRAASPAVALDPASHPALAPDGTVVWRSEPAVVAAKREGGAWSAAVPSAMVAGPVMVGELVVAATADMIMAWHAADGTTAWRAAVTPQPAALLTGDAQRLLVTHPGGAVSAVSAADGSSQWSFDAGDSLLNQPRLIGDRVLVVSKDRTLTVLDAASGTVQHQVAAGPNLLVAAAVIPGDDENPPLLVTADIAGHVVWRHARSLEQVHQMDLGVRPVGDFWHVQRPLAMWRNDEHNVPGLVLGAVDGLAYVLSRP